MNGEQRLATCCPSCGVAALVASLATVENDPEQLVLYVICQEQDGGCGIEYSFIERLQAPGGGRVIAYCWATGLIEFGEHLPEHAILIASGEAAQLRKVVSARARHGQGESQGCLLVPGVPEAVEQAAKGDALGHWLAWCAQVPKGLRWGGMAAAPARRDPLTRKTQVIAVVRDGGRIIAGARPGIRRLLDSLGEEVPAWQTALTAAQAQLLKEKN